MAFSDKPLRAFPSKPHTQGEPAPTQRKTDERKRSSRGLLLVAPKKVRVLQEEGPSDEFEGTEGGKDVVSFAR